MRVCGWCHAKNALEARFCHQCGALLSPRGKPGRALGARGQPLGPFAATHPHLETTVHAPKAARQEPVPEQPLTPATALRLRPLTPDSDGAPLRELRCFGRHRFRIGKNRHSTEWFAWFWPMTPANEDKTRRISQIQAYLTRCPNGIAMRDGNPETLRPSQNGSAFNAIPLAHDRDMVFPGHGTITLADLYSLELTHLPPAGKPPTAGSATTIPPLAPADFAQLSGCLRLRPTDTEPPPAISCWIFTEATLGKHPDNPLPVPCEGIADSHLRIHHAHGTFWIEALDPIAPATLNGQPLAHGHPTSLANQSLLDIGPLRYRADLV